MNDKFNRGLQEIEAADVPNSLDIFGLNNLPPAREQEVVEVVREIVVENPNALVPAGDGRMAYKRVVMTDHGMEMPEDMTELEWQDVGHTLKSIEGVITWNIADWAAFANWKWGISYADIARDYGYQEDTVKSYASVSRATPWQIRLISNQPLPFSHARELAPFSEHFGLQECWASYVLAFRLTVEEVKLHKWLLSDTAPDTAWAWLDKALLENTQIVNYPEFADKLAQRNQKPNAVVKAFDKDAAVIKRAFANPAALKGKQLTAARAAVGRLREWLNKFESQLPEGN